MGLDFSILTGEKLGAWATEGESRVGGKNLQLTGRDVMQPSTGCHVCIPPSQNARGSHWGSTGKAKLAGECTYSNIPKSP